MAHAFAPIPAKPAFGTLKENLYQSDYITRKKAKYTYCRTPTYCQKMTNSNSYAKLYLYNLGRYSQGLENCNVIPVNKGNLIIGQYSKLNLQNVCTVSSGPPPSQPCGPSPDQPNVVCNPCQNTVPVQIDPSSIFYQSYTIDPLGELFGASQCGELNYTRYMVFNPPTGSLNP